jgi:hypothetical protein
MRLGSAPSGELLGDPVEHEVRGLDGPLLPREDAHRGDAVELELPQGSEEGVPVDLALADVAARTVGPPMLISQAKVEAALRDRFAELGGAPEWGVALVDAAQEDSGVIAVLGNGKRYGPAG